VERYLLAASGRRKTHKVLVKAAATHRKKTSKPEQKLYTVIFKFPQAVQLMQPTQSLRDSQL
jgi:hypothetical protein